MFYIVKSTKTCSCSEEKSESHVVCNCPLAREKEISNTLPEFKSFFYIFIPIQSKKYAKVHSASTVSNT